MSCWVVPTIAAEYWRVPVQHVLDCIERNAVPVRRENGFTFVDILPDPKPVTHRIPKHERPQTYQTVVTETVPSEESHDEPEVEDGSISYRPVRRQTAQLRKRPMAMA